MIKKLDSYTVKTFFGPFFFIFSVLFFIFIVLLAWQEMEKFIGKSLGWLTIAEMLFYLGINFMQLVLPLTILLGSIMTFGGLGERYELAAMKASGISLFRIMRPLFVVVFLLAVGLYFFGDRAIPYSQRKAKNMQKNILQANPTVAIHEGVFTSSIPGIVLKVDNVLGENNEKLEGVFIHKQADFREDKLTILSKRGVLAVDEYNDNYLKMELFDGVGYQDDVKNKSDENRARQPNQVIVFDTLNIYVDISSITNDESSINEESITDHYTFLKGSDLNKLIDSVKIMYSKNIEEIGESSLMRNSMNFHDIKKDSADKAAMLPFSFDKLKNEQKEEVIRLALDKLTLERKDYAFQRDEIRLKEKNLSKLILRYEKNLSSALICIIFFLIGAPLGAIVKKGGIGMPVLVSIIVFILYYIITFTLENMAKNGQLNPVLSVWGPNAIFFPISLFLFYMANNESELFDLNNYKDAVMRFIAKFRKPKITEEHSRYQ